MYIILIVLSTIISFLLIGPGSIPNIGIALSSLFITVLTTYIIKPKTIWSYFLVGAIVILSLFLMIRSNPLVIFLDVVAILYLMSFLALNKKPQNLIDDVFLAPLLLFGGILTTKNAFKLPSIASWKKWSKESRQDNYNNISKAFVSIVIGLIILAIVSAILASANPIFGGWVESFINWLNPFELLNKFSQYAYLRLIFFGLFMLFLPRYVSLISNPDCFTQSHKPREVLPFSFDIAKVFILIVLSLFFVSQFQLYTASAQQLTDLGITLSQKTREVFFQLSVVSVIILSILYLDFGNLKRSRYLSWGLITYGLILTTFALYSDLQYINSWGFTFARLYGLIGVGLIASLFGIITIWQYGKKELPWFIQASIFAFVISLVLVNILNFDFLIYHFKKSSTHSGVDYVYLSRLSPDSLSYQTQISELLSTELGECDLIPFQDYTLKAKIDYIDWLYSDAQNWRSFSLLGLLAHQQIEQSDTEALKKRFDRKYGLPCTPPSQRNQHRSTNDDTDSPQEIEVTPTPMPPIEITLSEISESLFNRNYQILNFNNQQVAIGSLDFNKFNHMYGPGRFTIRLYQVEGLGDEVKSSVIYEKSYLIPKADASDILDNEMTL